MTIKHPLLRYFGGKFRLAPWIISHFPKHEIYVEAFGGAAGVLLQKPRLGNEVYNDLNNDVVNLFRVLRDPILSKQLIDSVALTPFHRTEYFNAGNIAISDPVELARRMLIGSFMSFSSVGSIKGCSGFSGSTKKGKTTDATVWAKIPNNLAFICQRLTGVIIENIPALELLQKQTSPARAAGQKGQIIRNECIWIKDNNC